GDGDNRNRERSPGGERAHRRKDHLAREVAGGPEYHQRIGSRQWLDPHGSIGAPSSCSRRLGARENGWFRSAKEQGRSDGLRRLVLSRDIYRKDVDRLRLAAKRHGAEGV